MNMTQIYYEVQQKVQRALYYDNGIELRIDKHTHHDEIYYEIEKSTSSWRSAEPNSLNVCDKIVQEYRHETSVFSHSLLFTKKESQNQFNICGRELEMQKKGHLAVDLYTGDLMRTLSFDPPGRNYMRAALIKKNEIGIEKVMPTQRLLEKEWHQVNGQFLNEMGLKGHKEINVVWMLIDSFVVRTDPSKTSALVIGEYFDIGLRFVDILKRNFLDLTVVTDLARAVRTNRVTDYTLQVKKRHDQIPYYIYLSTEAKEMLKNYISTFPELKKYILKSNKDWFQNLSRLPKDHDVRAPC